MVEMYYLLPFENFLFFAKSQKCRPHTQIEYCLFVWADFFIEWTLWFPFKITTSTHILFSKISEGYWHYAIAEPLSSFSEFFILYLDN